MDEVTVMQGVKDNKDKKIVFFMFRESLLQSILSDLISFGLLIFCIWFSHGSKFWTFVCFMMFLTNMTSSVLKRKGKIFDNKESLRKWASEE